MHRFTSSSTSDSGSLATVGVLATERDRATLVDMLASRSRMFRERLAFRFLDDQGGQSTLTYGQLDQSARGIAVALQERFAPGSRALLIYPPGPDFIQAFFGCLYAGVLAVPATYPKPRRPSARLAAIAGSARPSAILTTQRAYETLYTSKIAAELDNRPWLVSDTLDAKLADDWQPQSISANDIAFLQYTSGSTSEPRGVEVTHNNIMHNLEMIRRGFALPTAEADREASLGVSWLPAYHDMGLIGGTLESLYVGGTTVLMSPLSFLQRPERWLRAISEYGAIVSGAPNFAYELCVRKIESSEIEGLDLTCWRVAFSGAEPVRAETLRRFAQKFWSTGFRESAFYPCYGLAEATLLVTGGLGPGELTTRTVQAVKLQELGRAVPATQDNGQSEPTLEFVSCGRPLMGEEVLIVDPETRIPCCDGEVGEIWIKGQNVARGYWNAPSESEDAFSGQLANSGEGHFLKSGDLGFVQDGSLFVTGRLKELLIIRGRNHYPHDLEATVQSAHDRLIPGGGAAFLIEDDGDDSLVVVQEVDRPIDRSILQNIIREMRRRMTDEHDLFAHEVILIRQGTLPRTTSGKVRRAVVRKKYLNDDLKVVFRWSFRPHMSHGSKRNEVSQASSDSAGLKQLLNLPALDDREKLADEIQSRLLLWLSRTAEAEDDELDAHRPFAEYGLDSLTSVELIVQLEDGLGLQLSPTIAWKYPTPLSLARHLSGLLLGDTSPDRESWPQPAVDDSFEQLLSQIEGLPEERTAELLAGDDCPEGRA